MKNNERKTTKVHVLNSTLSKSYLVKAKSHAVVISVPYLPNQSVILAFPRVIERNPSIKVDLNIKAKLMTSERPKTSTNT